MCLCGNTFSLFLSPFRQKQEQPVSGAGNTFGGLTLTVEVAPEDYQSRRCRLRLSSGQIVVCYLLLLLS